MSKLIYGYCTDKGIVKEINEDSVLLEKLNDKNGVFAIADGMGGHSCGDKASRIAIEELQKLYLEKKETLDLQETMARINKLIYKESMRNEIIMGTTLSTLFIKESVYEVCNIGDSRVYLIRDGIIRQLTEDDSLVYQQYKAKVITKKQYLNSDRKNILLKSIGSDEEVSPSFIKGELKKNDIFIVSCDGFHNVFKEEELANIILNQIKSGKSLGEISMHLVGEAKNRESTDNISVVLLWNMEEDEELKGFSKIRHTLRGLIE